jgi:hypothetical protein
MEIVGASLLATFGSESRASSLPPGGTANRGAEGGLEALPYLVRS